MPQKTKTQLRDELEQAKKELAEVQAKTQAEVTAARESEWKLQELEQGLKHEVAETRWTISKLLCMRPSLELGDKGSRGFPG